MIAAKGNDVVLKDFLNKMQIQIQDFYYHF